MITTNTNLSIIPTTTDTKITGKEKSTTEYLVNNASRADANSKKINDRAIENISPKQFIANIKYFIDICDLDDEQEAIKKTKFIFSKLTKGKIEDWLRDNSILVGKTNKCHPVEYAILCNKINLVKQLLTSIKQSSYSLIEHLFYKVGHQYEDPFHVKTMQRNATNANILKKSLDYNDLELTIKLLLYFIQDKSICPAAFNSLIYGTIDKGQLDIFVEVLTIFISLDKKNTFLKRYKRIECNDINNRPLEFAIIKNNYGIVKFLLEQNIPINCRIDKKNALFFALKNNNLAIIKLLAEHGVNFNEVLYDDVKPNKIIPFWKNITKIPDNNNYYYRIHRSHLEHSIKYCDIETISWLIENGANSFTPLTGQENIVGFQLTPLHLAIYLNKPDVVALLIETKINRWNDTAIYISNTDINNHSQEISYITAKEYAHKLKDDKNRAKIIAMIN